MATNTTIHLGPFAHEGSTHKAAESEQIQKDIKKFEAAGGRIEKLEPGQGRAIDSGGKSRQSMNRAQRAHASKKRQAVGALPGDSDILGYGSSRSSKSIGADVSLDEIDEIDEEE